MTTPSGTFLTQQEIRELTGFTVKAKQAQWLADKRWPFELDNFNRPVVLRSIMKCKLGDPDSNKERWSLDLADVA